MSAQGQIEISAESYGWTVETHGDFGTYTRNGVTITVLFARGNRSVQRASIDGVPAPTTIGGRDSGKLDTVLSWLQAAPARVAVVGRLATGEDEIVLGYQDEDSSVDAGGSTPDYPAAPVYGYTENYDYTWTCNRCGVYTSDTVKHDAIHTRCDGADARAVANLTGTPTPVEVPTANVNDRVTVTTVHGLEYPGTVESVNEDGSLNLVDGEIVSHTLPGMARYTAVCPNEGNPVPMAGDMCPSCIDNARASDLYFQLHMGINDSEAIIAELKAMGQWETDEEFYGDEYTEPAPRQRVTIARDTWNEFTGTRATLTPDEITHLHALDINTAHTYGAHMSNRGTDPDSVIADYTAQRRFDELNAFIDGYTDPKAIEAHRYTCRHCAISYTTEPTPDGVQVTMSIVGDPDVYSWLVVGDPSLHEPTPVDVARSVNEYARRIVDGDERAHSPYAAWELELLASDPGYGDPHHFGMDNGADTGL